MTSISPAAASSLRPIVPFGPSSPAADPAAPSLRVSQSFVVDLTEASRLAARAVDMLARVPADDRGSAATKDLRIRIFKTDMAAQERLERQLRAAGNDSSVVSDLRHADALLEDANWQLAKKPSPDGRFNGVDIPGAAQDLRDGVEIINALLRAAGGRPTEPRTGTGLPPVNPPTTTPPTTEPPTVPTTPVPPVQPPTTTPPAGGGDVDPDYPGEDEFPTDDDILGRDS